MEFLYDLAMGGNLEVVEHWVKGEPRLLRSKSADGLTLLHAAARCFHPEVAEFLLARGAEIEARTNKGFTPLHYAAQGSCQTARLLLSRKANVKAKSEGGETPLHLAARTGAVDMVTLLIAHGADVNARSNDGETPLFAAILTNELDYIKDKLVALLISKGAEVNAKIDTKGDRGISPLHAAAGKGRAEIVELLLGHNANVSAQDEHGATPLRYATNLGHKKVADLLRQHGGQ